MSAASTPPNHERYVDFDEYVEFQLDKTRKSIKSNDLLAAVAASAALLLGLMLVFVVLDHWVIADGFSVTARWAWFLVLVSVSAGWITWKVVRPSLRRVNRLFAARELEQASPALKSNLLNWVDLRDAGRDVHPSVMQTMEKRAATQLSKIDVAQAVDHRSLLTASYALLAIVMLFCGYALFSPKKISTALWRIFPFSRAHAVTRTEILEVTPGDATLLLRGRLDVSVVAAGEIPESVQFLYTTVDGRIQDESLLLRPESTGSTRFRGVFAGENGTGVLQDFSYVVIAGDARSRRYHVTVHQPPSATVNQVSIHFPAYMKLEDAVSSGGNIDGWEGAEAIILAKSDKPTKSAVLQFLDDSQSPLTGEEIPVTVTDATELRATWKLDLRTDGTFPKHYRIQCRNEAGEVDPSPVSYDVLIRPDLPPEVALLYPERDLEAPANAVIPLLVQASDPDFELGYVNLHVEKAGQSILREPLSDGRQQRLTVKHNLELEPLHLKPGEEVEFWVEAFDNKQPRRNRKNTPRLKIKIEQPVSQQQAAEQLAEEQQQRDQRLAEANNEQNRRDGAQSQPGERDADTESDREPADRAEQDRAEQNADQSDQSKDSPAQSGSAEASQPGNKEQRSRQPSQSGANGQGDSADAEPSSETPLSPDGEDDEEALRRLNERLKSDREQPSEETRGADQQEEQRRQPMPKSEGSEEGDDRSQGGGSGEEQSSNQKNPGENSPSGDAPQPMPDGEAGGSEQAKDAGKSKPAESKNSAGEAQEDKESTSSNSAGKEGTGKPQGKSQQPGDQGAAKGKNAPDQKPGAGKDAAEQTSDEQTGDGGGAKKPPAGPDQKDSSGGQRGKSSQQPSGKEDSENNATQKETNSSDSDERDSSPADSQPQTNSGKKNAPKNGQPGKNSASKSGENNSGANGDQQPGDEGSSSAAEEKDDANSGGDKPGKQSSTGSDREQPKGATKGGQKKSAEAGSTEKNQESGGDESTGPKSDRDADGAENRRPGKGSGSNEQSQPAKSRSSQKNPNAQKTESENDRDVENSDEPAPTGKQNSDGDPNAADEEMKGPGRKEGQRSDQPQGGEAGGSKQDKQGNSGSQTKGPGEKSSTPGKEATADDATGQSDPQERPGKGSKIGKEGQPDGKPGGKESGEQGESKSGEQSGEPSDAQSGSESGESSDSNQSSQGKSGKGKSSGKGAGNQPSDQAAEGEGQPGSQPGANAGGNPAKNDGAGGNGSGAAGGQPAETAAAPDEANLEYNRQAAELVLQRVRDDLNSDRVDPKLLEDLGWDADQLKRFTDRLAKQLEKPAGELTPQDEARRRQFEEMLKNLDLKSGGAKRSGGNSPNREIDQSGVRRAPVSAEYKASWEAFTRSLSKTNRSAPKPPDASSKPR